MSTTLVRTFRPELARRSKIPRKVLRQTPLSVYHDLLMRLTQDWGGNSLKNEWLISE